MANTSAQLRAGRIVLVERSARGDAGEPTGVSVRATGVVRRALAASRTPVRYVDLADRLVAETPGADRHRVESLLDELSGRLCCSPICGRRSPWPTGRAGYWTGWRGSPRPSSPAAGCRLC